ncbi:UDP-glucose dehydrogenase family protein [Rhodococcus gordoniae]|uniref:UDP-glucose dehydrogenase family protein n=1 Tax=Rhodococcus gordoniae TaxID=223392 RepID=UPI0020CDD8B9|nr:UDP-glucose/GDP-mannose dehydrogenase family protein [Rhodococcus gordoniae]UTT48044.1 UDP-glucose/GDP-mannose dehydrogenase family protein [Rhodococcus gordoniae]
MARRIAVFGTGYLGATHAACMAELGHEVLGVDVDPSKLAKLAAGQVPFYEPGLEQLLIKNLESGRLRFTDSYEEAATFADTHFIGVGTPQKRGEFAADITFVDAVIETLAPLLRGNHVIFGKSTVPVGTAERLRRRARQLAAPDANIELAWNPEFLREGFAVQDTLRPDRLVLGVAPDDPGHAEAAARDVYRELLLNETPFIVTDLATSELVKTAANAFLATKISFINAMAEVCEVANADVTVLADAIGHDNRIGRRFLNAGIGFGGGCLPKDIRAFMARAGEIGADEALTFLREVDNINMRRRVRTVEMVRELVGGSLLGTQVAVLGAAFKPDSDDVRDSPALSIAGQIQLQGASVNVYDPKAIENSQKIFPTLGYASNIADACKRADVTLVLTEWDEFRSMQPSSLNEFVNQKIIVDGRNCLDPFQWRAHGWTYKSLGRR